MDDAQFWTIVDDACRSSPDSPNDWTDRLEAALGKLPVEEIFAWDHIFGNLTAQSYTVDLWAAAYLINEGASDDGFDYFRGWLIGMGREVFETALANPDSLADVAVPGMIAEAEIYAAPLHAWMAVTGNTDLEDYPPHGYDSQELQGDDWDFDDNAEVRRRLPRLAALFLEE